MDLDDLVDIVVQDVPQAPLMTIREQVRRMARELCTEANVWVQRDEPVVVAADSGYPEVVASRGEPLRIVSLTLDGRERVQGDGFEQPTPRSVVFHRTPSDSVIYGKLACRPRRGDMPPSDVVERWAEIIADGARWRLLLLPQPWRAPELAEYYRREFQSGIAEARQASRLGHARGGGRVKMRRFI